ncbi:MAG TPA: hypothetical protein DCZ92_00290 [Elusimicrobia bacterium]|nr:MAG: hypothetical protein A2016_09540 [Elusimicrobia bacterium GWF2_62_30]HBA59265.1 hypothetical protein [Elusimicrobiota bacterium]
MNDDEKDKKLLSLLAAPQSEAFWTRQKEAIIAATRRKSGPARAWLLVPAAGLAALLVAVFGSQLQGPRSDAPQAVSTAFLEHLDLLDDMDVLEAIPEEEL